MSSYYVADTAEIRKLLTDPAWQRQQTELRQQAEQHALNGDFRRSLHNAFTSSEIRRLGARLTDFCQRLEPFLGTDLTEEHRLELIDLYTRFSAEIDVIQAAAHQIEGAGEIIDSFVDALRTPLEEGIIAYVSNPHSSYRDPSTVKSTLVAGYRYQLSNHASLLKGLSPTSSHDDFPAHVRIEEYGQGRQPLSTELSTELLRLNNSRVIDPTCDAPQEGFQRALAVQELLGFVERTSTVCCVPCDDHGALGYYVLDTDRANIPEVARRLIEQDPRFGQLHDHNGWVDVIALATTARDRLRGPHDVWYIAQEYDAGSELNPSDALYTIALLPAHASDIGPGDYVRDTSGTLHCVHHNPAYGESHPSSFEITTSEGHMYDGNDIDLYLKVQEISSSHTPRTGKRPGKLVHLTQALSPTSVTEVMAGDFIRDMQGVLREIEHNSATGELHPRSWQIRTTDGENFGIFDISAYLKRERATEAHVHAHKPPSLYRWLTRAACETACSEGISTLWCQVRIGNTAREKHLAVGWESTGLLFRIGNHEFEILRLDPFNIVTGLSETEVEMLGQQQSEHRPEYARLRALATEAWSTQPGASSDKHFLEIIRGRFPGCDISTSTDSIGRLRVTVHRESQPPAFFQQGLAGHDLWRVQSDPCYSLSLYNPLTSLEHLYGY